MHAGLAARPAHPIAASNLGATYNGDPARCGGRTEAWLDGTPGRGHTSRSGRPAQPVRLLHVGCLVPPEELTPHLDDTADVSSLQGLTYPNGGQENTRKMSRQGTSRVSGRVDPR